MTLENCHLECGLENDVLRNSLIYIDGIIIMYYHDRVLRSMNS